MKRSRWVEYPKGTWLACYASGPSFVIEHEEGMYTLLRGRWSTRLDSFKNEINLGRYKTLSDAQQAAETSRKTSWKKNPCVPGSCPKISLSRRAPDGKRLPSVIGHFGTGPAVSKDWHYYCVTRSFPTVKAAVADAKAKMPQFEWRGGFVKKNPGFGDYLRAGKRAAAAGVAQLAAETQASIERTRRAAEAEVAKRQCDPPTVKEAIQVLAAANGMKVNPRVWTTHNLGGMKQWLYIDSAGGSSLTVQWSPSTPNTYHVARVNLRGQLEHLGSARALAAAKVLAMRHTSKRKANPAYSIAHADGSLTTFANPRNPSAATHKRRMQQNAGLLREQITAAQSALARGQTSTYLVWLESLREMAARVSQDAKDASVPEAPYYYALASSTMAQLRRALNAKIGNPKKGAKKRHPAKKKR